MGIDYTAMDRTAYPELYRDKSNKVFQQVIVLPTGTNVRQQLGSAATGTTPTGTLSKKFTVQSAIGNSGSVYVGDSGVSSTEYLAVLSPGASVDFTLWNTGLIWVTGTGGDSVVVGGEQ
jgi:hypothetical protein